jgi:ABC-type Na+ efflux pump permease subunit
VAMLDAPSSVGCAFPAATAPRHRLFSPGRVGALATVTFTELVRLKVFYFVVIFALALIASPLVFSEFVFRDHFQMLRDVGLGAMSIFSSLLAVLATAGSLPRDAEDRTLYTILAKPMSRFEYLCGKLLGILGLLGLALVLMAALFLAVLFIRERIIERDTLRIAVANGLDADSLAVQVRALRGAAFTPGLPGATLVIYAKCSLLAAMTLLISTFATSTIFSVLVAAVAYFIGHFQALAREAWLLAHPDTSLGVRLLLGVVVLVFPDLQLFNVIDETVAGVALPAALVFQTVGFGVLYCAIYLLAAHFIFSVKAL